MTQMETEDRIDQTCELFGAALDQLEKEVLTLDGGADHGRQADSTPLYEKLEALSHEQARCLTDLTRQFGADVVADRVRNSRLHREHLMRSAFIRRALEKPRGYAGDMELMLMICQSLDAGDDLYSRLINRVYLRLPASEAVRRRIGFLTQVLDQLRPDATVLNLACGPALELQRSALPASIRVDLVDHDPNTLDYLIKQSIADGVRVRALLGNAFRLMAGNRSVIELKHEGAPRAGERAALEARYDLVYSAGLYDYVPDGDGLRSGAAPLTRQLFDLLRPGGRLLIGNFLAVAPGNPHLMPHRIMMELYSAWHLIYRTPDELFALLTLLPAGQFSASLLDENGVASDGGGTIGFLDVRRLA